MVSAKRTTRETTTTIVTTRNVNNTNNSSSVNNTFQAQLTSSVVATNIRPKEIITADDVISYFKAKVQTPVITWYYNSGSDCNIPTKVTGSGTENVNFTVSNPEWFYSTNKIPNPDRSILTGSGTVPKYITLSDVVNMCINYTDPKCGLRYTTVSIKWPKDSVTASGYSSFKFAENAYNGSVNWSTEYTLSGGNNKMTRWSAKIQETFTMTPQPSTFTDKVSYHIAGGNYFKQGDLITATTLCKFIDDISNVYTTIINGSKVSLNYVKRILEKKGGIASSDGLITF